MPLVRLFGGQDTHNSRGAVGHVHVLSQREPALVAVGHVSYQSPDTPPMPLRLVAFGVKLKMIAQSYNPATLNSFMGTKCPTCGKSFKSLNGMSVHHTKAHGVPIDTRVTVECAWCGSEKKVHQVHTRNFGRHFCSIGCEGDWKSEHYKPHNKKPPVEQICEQCGTEFSVKPSETDRKFCSRKCYHAYNRETNRFAGENNAQWKEKVQNKCEWCGGSFEVMPCRASWRRFCSNECLNGWKSSITGPDHPLWRAGGGWYRHVRSALGPVGWHTLRREHLNDECKKCGESGGQLHLHHIVPVLAGGTNEPWNFMTLCGSCHTTAERYTESIPGITPILAAD